MKLERAFSLVELLVVIAIIGLLAALLIPSLARAKARAEAAVCVNNLKQIDLGIHMYIADNTDTLPSTTSVTGGLLTTNHWGLFYKRLIKGYLELQAISSAQDKVFACPADQFFYDFPSLSFETRSYHDQAVTDFSSYGFNGANGSPLNPQNPGIFGRKQAAIKNPSLTLLVAELPAYFPFSWHQPLKLPSGKYGINDAKNVTSFVDGHIDYIKIYWNPNLVMTSANYDPPSGYEYKRSGD